MSRDQGLKELSRWQSGTGAQAPRLPRERGYQLHEGGDAL
jgi:hypothetical protein